MYLSEDISNDYRFALDQQKHRNSRPFYPHRCNFIFKVDPSLLVAEGYVENEAKIVDNIPWKMFVKVGGKELYPFMNVGIVDHNNVEEISYTIILQGIKAEYDEKRNETVKISEKTNKKLFCNEKIWYRSLFDTSESPQNHQKPLIFEVSIKYRLPGEKFESFLFQQPTERYHEANGEAMPYYQNRRPWETDLDDDMKDTSLLHILAFWGIIYLFVANALEINFLSSLFNVFCYLLSLAFTLIFFFFDVCFWILYSPLTQFSKVWDIFDFFLKPHNTSNIDTVFSSFFSSDFNISE